MPRRTPFLVLAVAAAAAGLLTAVPAAPAPAATRIAFACGPDICTVRPDGTHRRRLTRDGEFGRRYYERPQLTANGRRLVFDYADRTYVADGRGRNRKAVATPPRRVAGGVTLRPGRAEAFTFTAVRVADQVFDSELCRFRLSTRRTSCTALQPGAYRYVGWGPRGRITGVDADRRRLCVVGPGPACDGRVLITLGGDRTFFGPTSLSPDGRYIAAGVELGEETRIVLFRASTGRRVRDLTRGHDDYPPSWSPDGRRVAFRRDQLFDGDRVRGSICHVGLRGGKVRCPAKRVVDAGEPGWGG